MRTSQHRTILYVADGNPNDQFTGTVHRDWRSDLGAAISWMISEGCAFPTLESKTVKRRRVYFCCVSSAIAALALFLGAALAQTDPAHKPTQTPGAADSQQSPGAVVRVHTDLVSIPVTVSDALNRFVLGLEKNDFQLFEDGEEQNVAFFSGEDAPLSVGLLFDESGSMSFKLRTSRDATAQLLNALSQEDEAFLVEFADLARVSVGFTGHTEAIRSALKNAQAGGLTAMLDAINTGLLEMNNAKNSRKAIVIVSDGGDNRSHYTAAQIESLAKPTCKSTPWVSLTRCSRSGLHRRRSRGRICCRKLRPRQVAEPTQRRSRATYPASQPGLQSNYVISTFLATIPKIKAETGSTAK